MIYCLAETREESQEHSISFIISISEGVLLFTMFVIGMIYLGKHGKLKKILFWSGDASTLENPVNQLNQPGQGGATSDTGQEESHAMISISKQ
jgi:hypothetical protein